MQTMLACQALVNLSGWTCFYCQYYAYSADRTVATDRAVINNCENIFGHSIVLQLFEVR
jgi:hypothetical protein